MKIGILETGLLNDKLSGSYSAYPVMFEVLLDRAGRTLRYQSYSVIRGEMPGSVNDCDGWLITGSRHGVYENLPWMLELQEFIRDIYQSRVPLVGICFGHQIIAQALGGEVAKSTSGWGVGVHSYRVDMAQAWMQEPPQQVRIYAFHQDQVVKLPARARVYSSSDFCPYAGLSYGDSIMTMQAHPEFEEEYELALLELYGGDLISSADASAAAAKMKIPGGKADTQMLAEWIVEFFFQSGHGTD
ncbi:MAG: type 1 glutamine amidotransferase [Gammaproteobacteria bacterium]|nr:type 1 glutamine amidotransferase [Gammaproteobacteria bacterium]